MGLFIYGTLRDRVLLERLAGAGPGPGAGAGALATSPAELPGHVVLRQAGDPFPYLAPRDGGVALGILVEGLTAAQMARLDAYETPFHYARASVTVRVNGRDVPALTYMPGPSVQAADSLWDFAEWEASFAPLAREAAVEIGSYDPPLSGAALRAQWGMIERRASARLRAQAEPAPSTLRSDPGQDLGQDSGRQAVTVIARAQLHGDFFKAGAMDLRHQTFRNTTSDVLRREFFAGTDAAIVLPYDPVSDLVLLVEQIRMGPLARGAANPWSLEPIAGMVDAHETPAAAAQREAAEEANLHDIRLEKMFAVYASPGNITDYFYCYAGLCTLPEARTYTGGLASEAEDLRLHIVPFADAFALIETGEANVGPLVMMLLWLDRNRDRLRAAA